MKKGDLVEYALAMEPIGRQMSNVCFNLSQRPKEVLTPRDCQTMIELFRAWDALDALRPFRVSAGATTATAALSDSATVAAHEPNAKGHS